MKLATILLALLTITGFTAQSQTADEIVDKYVEAMGGKDKMASLKSVKMTGNLSAQGMDIGVVFTKLHQKGFRVDMDINGTANYQSANPEKGSVFMPVGGMPAPQDMEATMHKSMVRQMDVHGPLFNYKDKGTTLELLGKETVDGTEAYKLKVQYKDGETSTYYIDTKTNRIVKTVSRRSLNGEEQDIENSFSDYKQNADGYWFAYTITSQQGPINFSTIESNVAVDETFFKN